VSESDTVDLGTEQLARSWPPWLIRAAAGVGVAATALIAVATGDRGGDASDGLPDSAPQRPAALHAPPPEAQLDVRRVEADLWDSSGFSYEVTLTNRSDTTLDLIDIGPAMSGTEVAWDRMLVLPAGRTTLVRVDFLVLNCLAATSSAAPAELRIVVRGQAAGSVAALAQVPTTEQAALIEMAGADICSSGGGVDFIGITLG
jgi:hypothetical protein